MADKILKSTGSFQCSADAGSSKTVVKMHIPLNLDCPMSHRLYDSYLLDGTNGKVDEIPAITHAMPVADDGTYRNIKQKQYNDEGVEIASTLVVKEDGDDAFISRMATLVQNIGDNLDVLSNILLEFEYSVQDEVGLSVVESAIYPIIFDNLDAFFATYNADGTPTEYNLSFFATGMPRVYRETETVQTYKNEVQLNVTDTLSYDATSSRISGEVVIAELADKEAMMTISAVDIGYVNANPDKFIMGYSGVVSSTEGTFNVVFPSPIMTGTTSIEVTCIVAGRVVHRVEVPVGTFRSTTKTSNTDTKTETTEEKNK